MKKPFKNSILLFFSQIGGYVIPIIELPILTRSLSSDVLGSVFFLQAIVLSLSIFVEYGFNYNATRLVSKNIQSKKKVSIIFTRVYSAKIFLFLLSSFFFLSYFSFYEAEFPTYWLIFSLMQFLGFSFSPYWFYQGAQNLKLPVAIDFIVRFTYLFLLFLLVDNDGDASMIVFLQGFSSLLITIITTYIAFNKVGRFSISVKRGIREIWNGFGYFLFKGGATLLLSLNVIIIGHFMSLSALSIFVSIEKVIKVGVGVFNPVINAFYPYFCQDNGVKIKIKFSLILFSISCFVSAMIYYLAPLIVQDFLKSNAQETVHLLQFFVLIIPLRVASQAIIVSFLLPTGLIKIVSRVTIISSLGMLFLSIISSLFYDLYYLIFSTVLIDMLIFIFYTSYIKRKKNC
ncbi:TPA: hypothetical protein I7783_19975 [Vibrio vulnificus]|nr:hypothetical protein [Vibrio vulnificus]